MKININQRKPSIGAKYRIFTNDQETHRAAAKLFRLLAEIQLFPKDSAEPTYVIKRKWAWFNLSYDLTRANGDVFYLRTVSFWKRHYTCEVGRDLYEIYGHRGRKFSIFKNDRQIAYWQKDLVSLFEGDNYQIVADNNVDAELLTCFCLAIDNSKSKDNRGVVSIDFHIGPQARPFDKEWVPKG